MSFEIYIKPDIAKTYGIDTMYSVSSLTIHDGYITIGNYHVPLSTIDFIREI